MPDPTRPLDAPQPRCPDPVSFQVRCNGALHRISWRPGKRGFRFHGHRFTDLRFMDALASDCRCARIFRCLMRKEAMDGVVPVTLFFALRAYRDYQEARGRYDRPSAAALAARLQSEALTAAWARRFLRYGKLLGDRGNTLLATIHLGATPESADHFTDHQLRQAITVEHVG